MNSDYSKIMDVLLEIKGDVGAIKQHLKSINGTVAKHEEDINKLKKFVYKSIGGLIVGVIILQGILANTV